MISCVLRMKAEKEKRVEPPLHENSYKLVKLS